MICFESIPKNPADFSKFLILQRARCCTNTSELLWNELSGQIFLCIPATSYAKKLYKMSETMVLPVTSDNTAERSDSIIDDDAEFVKLFVGQVSRKNNTLLLCCLSSNKNRGHNACTIRNFVDSEGYEWGVVTHFLFWIWSCCGANSDQGQNQPNSQRCLLPLFHNFTLPMHLFN